MLGVNNAVADALSRPDPVPPPLPPHWVQSVDQPACPIGRRFGRGPGHVPRHSGYEAVRQPQHHLPACGWSAAVWEYFHGHVLAPISTCTAARGFPQLTLVVTPLSTRHTQTGFLPICVAGLSQAGDCVGQSVSGMSAQQGDQIHPRASRAHCRATQTFFPYPRGPCRTTAACTRSHAPVHHHRQVY